ncbi:MAG: hypothetical protein AAFV45_05405 [Pseudomonadota bacterium]
MNRLRGHAAALALTTSTIGFVIVLGLGYALEALPPSDHFGVVAMLLIDITAAAGVITAWRYGRGVRKSIALAQSTTLPERVRDVALAVCLGAVSFPVAVGLFIEIEQWVVAALLILIVASWAAMRFTRPPGPDRVQISEPSEWQSRPAISNAKGEREQRLAAYLCFCIPAVAVAVLLFVTPQLAPAFALIGLVSGIVGAAMEYYLWSVRWDDDAAKVEADGAEGAQAKPKDSADQPVA